MIVDKEPFYMVKFNDGEWHAMVGKNGTNCDNHTYSPDLKIDLLESYEYLNNFAFISDYVTNFCAFDNHQSLANKIGFPVMPFVNFAILHDLPYAGKIESLTPELKNFYLSIRNDKRKKVLIGPERIGDGVEALLNIDVHVVFPLLNGYDNLDVIQDNLFKHLTDNCIILACCGFNSCIIASEVHKWLPNTTFIDVGSGLDPVAFGKTRKSQYTPATLRNEFYGDLGIEWPKMPHFYKEIPGWFNYADLYSEMVNRFPSGRFVEVGAWMGKSAAYLGVEIVNSGKDIKLDVVDHFKGSKDELGTNHKAAKVNNVKGLCTNNLRPFWSSEKNSDPYSRIDNMLKLVVSDSVGASHQYKDGSLEFVFIDAGHSYEEVKADIQAWLPKVRKGGVLAGHDYSKSFPGVIKAVKELLPNHKQVSKNCWMVEV